MKHFQALPSTLTFHYPRPLAPVTVRQASEQFAPQRAAGVSAPGSLARNLRPGAGPGPLPDAATGDPSGPGQPGSQPSPPRAPSSPGAPEGGRARAAHSGVLRSFSTGRAGGAGGAAAPREPRTRIRVLVEGPKCVTRAGRAGRRPPPPAPPSPSSAPRLRRRLFLPTHQRHPSFSSVLPPSNSSKCTGHYSPPLSGRCSCCGLCGPAAARWRPCRLPWWRTPR